jgi:hypothetical protein
MIKNWKSLFVKEEDADAPAKETPENFSFPITNTQTVQTGSAPVATAPVNDPIVTEVLQKYEEGLDSINMPGYDFYEFYKSVNVTGHNSEQGYNMAFQMARTLDKTISTSKLLGDAEFYISKINEVHSQYVNQGQQKLSSIQEEREGQKKRLQGEIDAASSRINQLRVELQQLESEVGQKRNTLMKVDDSFYPQEKTIRQKLHANDIARKASIDKLNSVKEGIQRFIKS